MARKRALNPEEAALWDAVARTTRRMHSERRARPAEDDAKPATRAETAIPAPAPRPPLTALGMMRIGDSGKTPSITVTPLPAPPIQMDSRKFARMKRGKLSPEARLDLHGHTLAQAHPELIRFILDARARELRLVLVITGKGRQMTEPVPRPTGVLRHQVPQWLRLPPLRQAVLQVTEAHVKHGGSGAYYVYLRRN